MSDTNFSAIRARLRYETMEDFIEGYARFISGGGMFIPMQPSKLKPIGTTIRFQFLLSDGSTALLGEGVVLQVRAPDDANPSSPVGMLIKFTKLSQESKSLVDQIISRKSAALRPQPGQEEPVQKHPTKPFPEEEDERAEMTSSVTEHRRDGETTSEVPADVVAAARGIGDEPTPPAEIVPAHEPEPEPEEEAVFDLLGLGEDSEDSEPNETAPATLEPQREHVQTPVSDQDDSPPPTRELVVDDVDPLTQEAPAEHEPATVEAESEQIEEELVEEAFEEPQVESSFVSEVSMGPKKLAGREGGLQVLAFDDMSDEEMAEFDTSFSFGADDSDIDDMFDGLFGGSEASEGMFGGASTSEGTDSGDAQPSVEIPLPDENDMGLSDEFSEAEKEAAAAILGIEAAMSDEEPEFSLDDDDDEEPFVLDDEAEEEALVLEEEADDDDFFSMDDLEIGALSEAEEDEEPLILSDIADEPSEMVIDPDEASFVEEASFAEDSDDDLDALIDFTRSPRQFEQEQARKEAEIAALEAEDEPSQELHFLLEHLEDEDEEEQEMTLHLGTDPNLQPAPEVDDDEESLEALLASAQKEIQEKQGDEEKDPDADILDQLLGDEILPPPADTPAFNLPSEKKKKGFISKLFGKD